MKKRIIIITALLFTSLLAADQTNDELLKRARELHSKILTLDTHADTPIDFHRNPTIDIGKRCDSVSVDLVKMQEGGLDAVFFAVYRGQGAQTDSAFARAYNDSKKQFASIYRQVEQNSDKAMLVTTRAEALQAKAQGKRAIFIGVENGYCLGRNISAIEEFYNMGARYLTLCHMKNGEVCKSSTDESEDYGLTDFGREIVREMNRVGMMIDVSHASDQTVLDVLACSKSPIIASHSSARAICNIARNLSDDLIRLIADKGGVVQVAIYTRHLRPKEQGRATVADIVDHIDHIVGLVGIDHVGFGSDFDGGGGVVGCEDASGVINITVEMLRRGYTDEDIAKFWGLNLLRVLEQVTKDSSN